MKQSREKTRKMPGHSGSPRPALSTLPPWSGLSCRVGEEGRQTLCGISSSKAEKGHGGLTGLVSGREPSRVLGEGVGLPTGAA